MGGEEVMPIYYYRARDPTGTILSGRESASSATEAAHRLRQRGLWVIELREDRDVANDTSSATTQWHAWLYEAFNPFRPKARHLAIFFRNLATMFAAGMTPHESLRSLATSAGHPRLRHIAQEGAMRSAGGERLSQVLQSHPEIFPPFVVNLVAVGEESGRVDNTLKLLAEYYEREHEHTLELRRETFYPLLLGAVLILFLAGLRPLIAFIQGSISGLVFLIALIRNALPYVLLILLCYFAYRALITFPPIRYGLDTIINAIPGIAGIRRRIMEARFIRALSLLYSAGVGPSRALVMAGEASGSEMLAEYCRRSSAQVSHGQALSEVLSQSARKMPVPLFQPTTIQMLITAEKTGMLDELLPRLAQQYEQEAQVALRQRAILMGVILLLIAGILIGMQVISFYAGYATAYGL
ncbi:MAG TPA: type II secretion system F family protein [Armatimonadetes bacterium]|nr:type II secretion system F family protein [Armatimonadota bacterium]